MPDEISALEAARRLRTTPPTIRSLLQRELLSGRREQMGTRFRWRVDRESVEKYLEAHGPFDERRLGRPVRTGQYESRLTRLEDQISSLFADPPTISADAEELSRAQTARDDLRARVVSLEESLARMRSVVELQDQADAERALVVEHLLAASLASERTDKLRRVAIVDLEEAVGDIARVGHLGDLGA